MNINPRLANNQRQIIQFPSTPGSTIDATKSTRYLAVHNNSSLDRGKAFASSNLDSSTDIPETLKIIQETFSETLGLFAEAMDQFYDSGNLNRTEMRELIRTELEMIDGLNRIRIAYQGSHPTSKAVFEDLISDTMQTVAEQQDFLGTVTGLADEEPKAEHTHVDQPQSPARTTFQNKCAEIARHNAFTSEADNASTPGQGIAEYDPQLWEEQIFAFPGDPFELPEGRSLLFFVVGEATLSEEEFLRQAMSSEAVNPLVTRHRNVLAFPTEGHTGLILLNNKNQPIPITIQRSEETGELSFVRSQESIVIPNHNETGIAEYSIMKLPIAVDRLSDAEFTAQLARVVPTINAAGIRYHGGGNSNRSVDAMAYALYQGLTSIEP
jgi:hypothetical protein